jgi:molecular chaperone DnaK
MRVLGIDFGTSNTVAMIRSADARMRPLLFDGSPLLPSAVYFSTDGKVLVGRDAERNARVDPARFEPNPKRRIDDGEVFLGGQGLPVPRIFGYVLSQVNAEARRQLGGAPDEVRLTHPARWGERRRSLLVEAARLAGLGTPRLIAEPVGAASYFTAVLGSAVPVGRSLAIYDLGGGTFDATVVRRTQTGFEVLAEEGIADVGGLDFDHAIVEHLGKTYAESNPTEWSSLVMPADPSDRRLRRMLYEDVRGAKEMLSRTASADIHLPALEVDAHVTREEFEGLIRPYLERTVACLKRAIEQARLTPQDLVGIFLVGGSSRIPLAAHLLHTELGVAPTTLEQPETVVVEGALCIGAPSGPARASGVPRTFTPPQPPPQQQRVQQPSPAASGSPVSPSPISNMPMSGAPMSGAPMSGAPMSSVPVSPAVSRPPVAPPRPPHQPPPHQPPPHQPPPRPPVQQPPVQPAVMRQAPPPMQQRPPVMPPPQPRPVPPPPPPPPPPARPPVVPPVHQQPVRSGPFPPQPARTPPPPPPPPPPTVAATEASERRWVGGTVVVLVLVAIGFVVLLAIAFSG